MGPEFSFLPTIQERDAIKVWAEIGVIVLLFGLGLEFSFKKLFAVGRGASITALTEILSMLGIGYLIGRAFGWTEMDSIFLGAILSISSTTIIIRAFEEVGVKQKRFVGLVFGVLVVEDLVAILLLVVLSTIAISQSFAGWQLIESTARLGFFLTLWFLGGIFLIPWFLRQVRPLLNQETSLIVSLGLCLLMVMLATHSGFSPALGAFIMGSILAETPDGERIEHNLRPVRDLFAAIFFVSVGMLIDLQSLADHWPAIIVISILTIFGKALSTIAGALMSGQRLKHSMQAGLSLAQIGEFSFIIATLGLSLKVISEFLYPLAVAVSVVTTFTTPYLIRFSDPIYEWTIARLPAAFVARFDRGVDPIVATREAGKWQRSLAKTLLNSVIVVGISISCSSLLRPFLAAHLGFPDGARIMAMVVAIFLSLPFLWAIVASPSQLKARLRNIDDLSQVVTRASLALAGRTILAIILLAFVVSQFTSALMSILVVAMLALLVGVLGFRNFTRIYASLESQFVSHLNERELEEIKRKKPKPRLAPWDAHLVEVVVHPNSKVVGQTLEQLALRESTGVTIALIERGGRQMMAPGRETILMAHDKAFAIGTDEQLALLVEKLGRDDLLGEAKLQAGPVKFGLVDITLHAASKFVGKSIRDCGIREETGSLIVGLERQARRHLNPDSKMVLEPEDHLWLVGDLEKIKKLSAASH